MLQRDRYAGILLKHDLGKAAIADQILQGWFSKIGDEE